MTGEQHIDYEALAQHALRSIVRTVLIHVVKSGLPGQHHFYIAFNTTAPGVTLSSRLKEKYPEEMTIVLQHRFWDLMVNEERFEVKLTFDGVAERLVVPFSAIKVFFDPSVPYGLQFEGSELAGDLGQDLGGEGAPGDAAPRLGATRPRRNENQLSGRAEKKPAGSRKTRLDKGEGEGRGLVKSRAVSRSATAPGSAGKNGRPQLVTSKPDQPDTPANDTKVVQLDKFRKK